MDYPQYRKYLNGKAYFKISSPAAFEEVQLIGSKLVFHAYEVKILPDRNFVYDLTFDYNAFATAISAEEYDAIRAKAI